jgi:diguanylate cyclase (GGDEF)-like protein
MKRDPRRNDEIKRHYMRLFALFSNLTENLSQFIPILLTHISEDFEADRLALMVKTSDAKFVLRGIIGPQQDDRIGHTYEMDADFENSQIYVNPTPGVGWDAYVSIRDENNEIIAVLAIDDTNKARNFSKDQRTILMHIKLTLEIILRQHNAIEQFRFIDPLTNILNRRGLDWKIQELKGKRQRNKAGTIAIAFIDIDDFGLFNKKHGEIFGDHALKMFTRVMQEKMRPDDIFGRWGGEEFLIIWENTGELLAKRLRDLLEKFAMLKIEDGEKSDVGLAYSGGVVELRPSESFEAAIKRANAQMRKAKKQKFTILTD